MSIGVVNLKRSIVFSLDLAEQIVTASKNGIKWTDAFGFIDEIMEIPVLIKTSKEIYAELQDLTVEERGQLNAEIAEEFDLDNDKVEEIVQYSIDVAFGVVQLVNAIKQRNAAK